MTGLAIATSSLPRQAIEAKGRSAPLKVTGKLKAALDFMVWECLKRPEAAAKAGLSDHGLREALRRPHVRAHYLSLLDVLRTSERARNIHRLVDIRDKADNMPAVQAIKMLEQLSDEQHERAGATQRAPGVTVIVVQGDHVNASLTRSDAKPLIEHDVGSHARDD